MTGGHRGACGRAWLTVIVAVLVLVSCSDEPDQTVVGADPGGSVVQRIDTVPQPLGSGPLPGSVPGSECAARFAHPLAGGESVEVESGSTNGGVVRAVSTADFPLGFGGAPRAHIVVRARDIAPIDASFSGTRFRRMEFGGAPVLTAAVESPVDGPVTIANRGATDQDVIAMVLIEKGERFTSTTLAARCAAAG